MSAAKLIAFLVFTWPRTDRDERAALEAHVENAADVDRALAGTTLAWMLD